jgi:hypothetical protein
MDDERLSESIRPSTDGLSQVRHLTLSAVREPWLCSTRCSPGSRDHDYRPIRAPYLTGGSAGPRIPDSPHWPPVDAAPRLASALAGQPDHTRPPRDLPLAVGLSERLPTLQLLAASRSPIKPLRQCRIEQVAVDKEPRAPLQPIDLRETPRYCMVFYGPVRVPLSEDVRNRGILRRRLERLFVHRS